MTLSLTILSLLFIFLLTGQTYAWSRPQKLMLWGATILFGAWFFATEQRAKDPILPISFFRRRGFSIGNAAVFMSSFAIFAFFGFAPLFIQGALDKNPMEVGSTVLALSLGWSIGSLVLGRWVHGWGSRPSAAAGAVLLSAGCALTLTFSTATSTTTCFWVFTLVGVGIGFVALATILVVQNSVEASDLGVATASHQFSRNLCGKVGVGICGSIFTSGFSTAFQSALADGRMEQLPETVADQIRRNADSVLRPDVQAQLAPDALRQLHEAISQGVLLVFWTTIAAALLCLFFCLLLPRDPRSR
jgi:predicted MFS family arabinose efflux permease